MKLSIYYLNLINTYARTGPGGIPSTFLKSCSTELARPFYLIFNKSLSLSYFSNIWKRSFVIPMYKLEDKHDDTNYRLIYKMSKTYSKNVQNFNYQKVVFNYVPIHT